MTSQCPTSESTPELVVRGRSSWTSRHPWVSLLLLGLCSALMIGLSAFLGAM